MTFRKYLVLAGITLFAATGDSLLSHGMKQVGSISLTHCYTTALSWADLTYVLPASSLGYVLLALIAKFFLHEHVSTMRWFGIALISSGVGFVTQGPALTPRNRGKSANSLGTRTLP